MGPAPKRTPRPQPKGLKARYQPLGVNVSDTAARETDSEVEDTEMTEAPVLPTTETPKAAREKKRKQQETPATVDKTKAKKDKQKEISTPEVSRKGKRKHTASEEDAAAAAEQLRLESKSAEKKSKKQKTNRTGSPDLGSAPPSAATKKQTPVLPPTFPQSTPSFSDIPASTPTVKAAATPARSSSKKSKKSKDATVETPSSALEKKQTPVPVPRQSVVPLPSIPHSSPIKAPPTSQSPALTKEEKRAKRKEEKSKKAGALASSQSAPSSSQASAGKKVTPVPPPMINGLG